MKFKNKYKGTWGIALKRQNYSIIWTKHFLPESTLVEVSASAIGKGADSIEWIDDDYSQEYEVGCPDYVWKDKKTKNHLMHVEVTHFRSNKPDAWVRPDKIEYAKRHPEINYWVICIDERQKPVEVKLIKPDINKDYLAENTFINEKMVKFYDHDPEVKPKEEYLKSLIVN